VDTRRHKLQGSRQKALGMISEMYKVAFVEFSSADLFCFHPTSNLNPQCEREARFEVNSFQDSENLSIRIATEWIVGEVGLNPVQWIK